MRNKGRMNQRSLPLPIECAVALTPQAERELAQALAELLLAFVEAEAQGEADMGPQKGGGDEQQDHQ